MEPEYIELLALQERVGAAVEDSFPEPLWVKAEIAGISVKGGGHCWLSLCQGDGTRHVAEARAVIWARDWSFVEPMYRHEAGADPEVGAEVLALALPVFHPLYGYSLTVSELKPYSALGEAEARRRETLARLDREGLMTLQRELVLPELPYALAVISAEDAAGYGDFRHHLLDNPWGYAYRVDLFPAAMQGVRAPESIGEALRAAESSPLPYDAVLILRGGGSALDLACFDDYDLAAAIARCALPVVTAIGHDRDVHVADLVANRSVKTPTALADLFLDRTAQADAALDALDGRLSRAFAMRFERLDNALATLSERLRMQLRNRLDAAAAALDLVEMRIRTTDPRQVLRRGFALVTDAQGKVLRGAVGRAAGERIGVYFADGSLSARIESADGAPLLEETEDNQQ